jgi:uncharacterized protein DUF3443
MVPRTLLFAILLAQELTPQCGAPAASGQAAPARNVQAIVVNAGPANNYFNGAFTSVTICVPGQTAGCQTIDGVLVDTGSTGLRVLSSALTLSLPQQVGSAGAPIVECAQFLLGFTWGPVKTADVRLAGEQASGLPIQVIDEASFPNIPTSCSSSGTAQDTLDTLGANAILGIGLFKQDCGLACAFVGSSNPGFYFACPASGCQPAAVSIISQVQNPVAFFPTDNNGAVIQLPAVAAGGAVSVTGSLIYGIGTQSNNALGSAKVLTVDAVGNITTVFSGQSYPSSFIDSGSNGIYFLDSASTGLPLCPDSSDFYCPTAPKSLSATNIGTNGVSLPALFNVGNADTLDARFFAFSEIAGPNPGGFDFGLGFFFGRSVFTALEGQATPGGAGPYFAY